MTAPTESADYGQAGPLHDLVPGIAATLVKGLATLGILGKANPRIPETPPSLPLHGWREASIPLPETGIELEYIEHPGPTDDAPTLLLAHGAFLDHRIWLNFDGLARSYRLVAPRWPDASPNYRGQLSDHCQLLAEFLKSLGTTRIGLIGVSFGGTVISQFAIDYGDTFNIEALILLASAVPGSSRQECSSRMRNCAFVRKCSDDVLLRLVSKIGGRQKFDQVPRPPQAHELFYIQPPDYYRQIFAALESCGFRKSRFDRVTAPVLLVHGTADKTIPATCSHEAHEVNPRSELELYEGWTHALAFLHGPELVERIRRFLSEHEKPS